MSDERYGVFPGERFVTERRFITIEGLRETYRTRHRSGEISVTIRGSELDALLDVVEAALAYVQSQGRRDSLARLEETLSRF